jgi:hypothetical protein
MKSAMAVKTVRCCMLSLVMGRMIVGNALAIGRSGLRRFIFEYLNVYRFIINFQKDPSGYFFSKNVELGNMDFK